MPSEILLDGRQSPAPVLWRTASTVPDTRATGVRADPAREAAARLEQARQEGYAAGIEAGRQAAEQQILPAMQNVAQALNELSRMRESIRETTTPDLVRLAISIASHVIQRDVAVDPDALAGLLRAAFSKLQSREGSRARVHPALEGRLRKCLEQAGAPASLVLQVDRDLKPGEIVSVTSQALLDASVDTRLLEIERGLIDKLGK